MFVYLLCIVQIVSAHALVHLFLDISNIVSCDVQLGCYCAVQVASFVQTAPHLVNEISLHVRIGVVIGVQLMAKIISKGFYTSS